MNSRHEGSEGERNIAIFPQLPSVASYTPSCQATRRVAQCYVALVATPVGVNGGARGVDLVETILDADDLLEPWLFPRTDFQARVGGDWPRSGGRVLEVRSPERRSGD